MRKREPTDTQEGTKMTAAEIIAKAEEIRMEQGFGYIGIRTQEEAFELGALNHNSVIWIDGEETEDELDGVCCTMISSERLVRMHLDGYYWGGHTALIAGDRIEYGEDEGEIIISGPQVVYIVK